MMFIHKMMTAGCKLRITLVIIISLATGFVSSVVIDSVFMVNYMKDLFTQDSMQDTLWLEFNSKGGYTPDGYNSYWIDNINSLKSIPGVSNIGVQVSVYSPSIGENVLAVSESLLSRMKLPISNGKWEFDASEQGIFPAVVSYDLSKKYPIGAMLPIQVEGTSKDNAISVTIKIIGVLNEFGGFPRLNVGQFISNPNLRNILFWHNLRNTLIIPLDALPWSIELGYQIESIITIHMTEEVTRSDDKIAALQETLYEKGFGFTNTGSVLVRRANEIESYNAGRNRLMIYLFILLTATGVVCYNIAFAYHKQRDLAVLRLLGVTKRNVAFNWVLMICYSHILPAIIGLSLGQALLSNGQAYFPHSLQIKWKVVTLGVIIIVMTVYGLSYCFLSKGIATSMKEE